MARIETYPLASQIDDNDKILGTDAEDSKKTKNFGVLGLKEEFAQDANVNLFKEISDMRFQWKYLSSLNATGYSQIVTKNDWASGTQGILPPGKTLTYPLLWIAIDGLTLLPEYDYYIVIYRYKNRTVRSLSPISLRYTGYKFVPNNNQNAMSEEPGAYVLERVQRMQITDPTGQWYDQKLDTYFSAQRWPKPLQYSIGTSSEPTNFYVRFAYGLQRVPKGVDPLTVPEGEPQGVTGDYSKILGYLKAKSGYTYTTNIPTSPFYVTYQQD